MGAGAAPSRRKRPWWAGALPATSGPAQLRWRRRAIILGDTEANRKRALKQQVEYRYRASEGMDAPIISEYQSNS